MSNPFDRVFENKIIFEKEDLFKNIKIDQNDVKKEDNLNENVLSLSQLEEIVDLYNNDLKDSFSDEEVILLSNTLESQKREAENVIEDIKSSKKNLVDKINRLGNAESLDISKRSQLKAMAVEVFGEEKNKITHEDYFVLLELRKEILKKETEGLIESSIDNA